MGTTFVKECKCGRVFDLEAWVDLPFTEGGRGMKIEVGDGEDIFLEMRNCPCGSTLAVDSVPKKTWVAPSVRSMSRDELLEIGKHLDGDDTQGRLALTLLLAAVDKDNAQS